MRTLLAALALVVLTGCSGGDTEGVGEESETPAPKVSAATTCGQLMDGDAPMQGVVDLMRAETMPSDAEDARGFADEMESIGTQADDELAPHVDVVVSELREFAEAVDGGDTFDTNAMVTSLTELNNVCGNTPRF